MGQPSDTAMRMRRRRRAFHTRLLQQLEDQADDGLRRHCRSKLPRISLSQRSAATLVKGALHG
jgi:hypothetical protein